MGDGYSASDYDAMFADATRTPAYLAAIAREVRPGDVVVEIGTGTGYFAIAAARAGARRVYAIERDASLGVAERLAAENGVADRVTFIRGDSRQLTLPERGDLLVTDLRGTLPLYGTAVPTLVDARARHLAPAARLLPQRDTVWAALCDAPRGWRELELALGPVSHGISRGVAARLARAALRRERVATADLRSAPLRVATLDYARVESPNVAASLDFTADRPGAAYGLALWFTADLAPGIAFTTAPDAPETVYAQAFLPFAQVLACGAGDRVACAFRATLSGDDYVYAWETRHQKAGSQAVEASFAQSSLDALMPSSTDWEALRAAAGARSAVPPR